MRPIVLTRVLVAGAVGAVAASQTTAGAANLSINGSLATNGIAFLDEQRNIGITSTGNLSGVTFTVFGMDSQGRQITEVITGPNNGTATSVLNYLTVTRIQTSGAVGTGTTVDTVATGASQEIPLNLYVIEFNVNLVVEVSGTVNYTVQYTFDDVQNTNGTLSATAGFPTATGGPYNWVNHSSLTSQTANNAGQLIGPTVATRIVTNSGSGTLSFRVIQSGLI